MAAPAAQTDRAVWIGVDGGATGTTVTVIDSGDHVLAEVKGKSTNANSVGNDEARTRLHDSISAALLVAKRTKDDVRGICAGLSGVDRPCDVDKVLGWCNSALPGVPASAHNDSIPALVSGSLGSLHGCVVICGTGMIAYATNEHTKKDARAAGWGPLLGDWGSGWGIGSQVLQACVMAADGRGPATALLPAVLKRLSLPDAEAIIGWTYSDLSWERIASVAPLAFELAESDQEAARIVSLTAQRLHDAILVTCKRAGLCDSADHFPVVLAGSVLLKAAGLADRVTSLVRQSIPHAQVTRPKVGAATGAAMLAKRSLV